MANYTSGKGKTYEDYVDSIAQKSVKPDYRGFIEGITGQRVQYHSEYSAPDYDKTLARYQREEKMRNQRIDDNIYNGRDTWGKAPSSFDKVSTKDYNVSNKVKEKIENLEKSDPKKNKLVNKMTNGNFGKPSNYSDSLKGLNSGKPIIDDAYWKQDQNKFNPAMDKMSDKVINSKFGKNVARPFVAGAVSTVTDLANYGESEEKKNAYAKATGDYKNSLNGLGKFSKFAGNVAGNMALSSLAPIGSSATVGKMTAGIKNPLLNTMAKEGIENAVTGAVTNAGKFGGEGYNMKQYAGDVAGEALGGALFSGGMKLAGDGVGKVKNELSYRKWLKGFNNDISKQFETPGIAGKQDPNYPQLEGKQDPNYPQLGAGAKEPLQLNSPDPLYQYKPKQQTNMPLEYKTKPVEPLVPSKETLSDFNFNDRNFEDINDMSYAKGSIMGQDENIDNVIQSYAGMIRQDLAYGNKGGKTFIDKETGKRQTPKRVQSEAFNMIINLTGKSYAEITESLKRIEAGEVKTALDRKIEIILDDVARNGTMLSNGMQIPPNEDYIANRDFVNKLSKGDYSPLSPKFKKPEVEAKVETPTTNRRANDTNGGLFEKPKAPEVKPEQQLGYNPPANLKPEYLKKDYSIDSVGKLDEKSNMLLQDNIKNLNDEINFYNEFNDKGGVSKSVVQNILYYRNTIDDIIKEAKAPEVKTPAMDIPTDYNKDFDKKVFEGLKFESTINGQKISPTSRETLSKVVEESTINLEKKLGIEYAENVTSEADKIVIQNSKVYTSPHNDSVIIDGYGEKGGEVVKGHYIIQKNGSYSFTEGEFKEFASWKGIGLQEAKGINTNATKNQHMSKTKKALETKREPVKTISDLAKEQNEWKGGSEVWKKLPDEVKKHKNKPKNLNTTSDLVKMVSFELNVTPIDLEKHDFTEGISPDTYKAIENVAKKMVLNDKAYQELIGTYGKYNGAKSKDEVKTSILLDTVDSIIHGKRTNFNEVRANAILESRGEKPKPKAEPKPKTNKSYSVVKNTDGGSNLEYVAKTDQGVIYGSSEENIDKLYNRIKSMETKPKADPKQEALDELKSKYESDKKLIEASGWHEEVKGKRYNALGVQYSAEKRKIIQGDSLEPVAGGLTAKELTAKVNKLNSNYVGKEVTTPRGEGKIVGHAFGKVKVEIDGKPVLLDPTDIEGKVKVSEMEAPKNTPNEVIKKKDSPVVEEEIKTKDEASYFEGMTDTKSASDEIASTTQYQDPADSKYANDTFQEKVDASKKTKQGAKGTQYDKGNNVKDNESAKNYIKDNPDAETKWWNGDFKSMEQGADTHIGMELFRKYERNKDYSSASKIISELSKRLSAQGQGIQAVKFYNSQDSFTMAKTIDSDIKNMRKKVLENNNKLNKKVTDDIKNAIEENNKAGRPKAEDEIIEEIYKKHKIPVLDDNQKARIIEIQNKVKEAKTDKEKIRLSAQRDKVARENIHKNFKEWLTEDYRYFSMLFNAKTLLARNPLSSLSRMATDSFGNAIIGKKLDKALAKKTNVRTRFNADPKAGLKQIPESYKDIKYDWDNNVDTSNGNAYDIDLRADSKLNRVLRLAMQLGDRPYSDAVEQSVLGGYMKEFNIKNVEDVPMEIRELARARGQENNFQNKHGVTNWLQSGKKTSKALKLAIETQLPFINTSLNIASDVIDRSPVGFALGMKNRHDLLKYSDKMSDSAKMELQKKAVDRLTKSGTGAITAGVGYGLAKLGGINDGEDENTQVNNLKKANGFRANSAKLGDYNVDLSQLSTINPSLLLGKEFADNGINLSSFMNGTSKSLGNAIASSPFSGLMKTIETYNQADDDKKIGSALASMGGNYVNQYIPTLIKQTAREIDPVVRDLRSESDLGYQTKNVINSIPFASKTLEPRTDAFGENLEYNKGMNGGMEFFNNYINPFLTSKNTMSKDTQKLIDAYKQSGETEILPIQDKKFTFEGKTYKLSADDKKEFARQLEYELRGSNNPEDIKEAVRKAYNSVRSDVESKVR